MIETLSSFITRYNLKKLTDCRFLFNVSKSSATTSNISDIEGRPFFSLAKSRTGGGPATPIYNVKKQSQTLRFNLSIYLSNKILPQKTQVTIEKSFWGLGREHAAAADVAAATPQLPSSAASNHILEQPLSAISRS